MIATRVTPRGEKKKKKKRGGGGGGGGGGERVNTELVEQLLDVAGPVKMVRPCWASDRPTPGRSGDMSRTPVSLATRAAAATSSRQAESSVRADGNPVVSAHGGLGLPAHVAAAARVASDTGVRLMSPDRPGVGRSDAQHGRTIWTGPATSRSCWTDSEERCAVMGWSLGGRPAAAVGVRVAARAHDDRGGVTPH